LAVERSTNKDKAADIRVALGTSKAGRSQDSQGASGGVE
jgi:hypothetical protein